MNFSGKRVNAGDEVRVRAGGQASARSFKPGRTMAASVIADDFAPLSVWLDEQNKGKACMRA